MTTEEKNKLIAEFMGLLFFKEYEKYDDYISGWEKESDGVWITKITTPQPFKSYHVRLNENETADNYFYFLKYNTSWDWFMPAWKKFRDLIENEEFRYQNTPWIDEIQKLIIWTDIIQDAIIKVHIEKSFDLLVLGIEKYNKIKKELV